MSTQQFRISGTLELITSQAMQALQNFQSQALGVTTRLTAAFAPLQGMLAGVGTAATAAGQQMRIMGTGVAAPLGAASRSASALSQSLTRVATSATTGNAALTALNTQLNQAATSSNAATTGLNNVAACMRGMRAPTRAAAGATGNLGGALMMMGAAMSALAFSKYAHDMLDAAMSTEKFRVQMNQIIRDKRKVDDLINFGEQWEAKSPFTLEEVQKSTVVFTKVAKIRGDDLGKVKDYVRMAGEYAATFNKPLEKATEGISKVMSGSALGLTIMRNNFQLSTKALRDLGVEFDKNGKIKNFQTQIEKINGAMKQFIQNASGGNAVIAQADTLSGRFTTLESEAYRTARTFGEAVAPMVMEVVNALIQLNQWVRTLDPAWLKIAGVTVVLGAAFTTLLVTVGPMIYFFGSLSGLMGTVAESMGIAGAGAVTVTGALASMGTAVVALLPAFAAMGEFVVGMIGFFVTFGSELAAFIATGNGGAMALSSMFIGTATGIEAAVTGITGATTAMAGMVASVAMGIKGFITMRMMVMGVAGAVAALMLQMQGFIDMTNQGNAEDNERIKLDDPTKLKAAQEAYDQATMPPPLQTMTEQRAARMRGGGKAPSMSDAERAKKVKALSPEALADYYSGGTSAKWTEHASANQNKLNALNPLGDHTTYSDKKGGMMESLMGYITPSKREEAAKTVADFERKTKGGTDAVLPSGLPHLPGLGDLQTGSKYEPTPQEIKDYAAAKKLIGSPEVSETNLKAREKYTKQRDFATKRAEGVRAVEEVYGLREVRQETMGEKLKENKFLEGTGSTSTVHAANELIQLREQMREKGKVTEEYTELDKAAKEQLYSYTDSLSKQSLAFWKSAQDEEAAGGALSMARKKEYLDQELQSIKDIEAATGVHTTENVQRVQELNKEKAKLNAEQVKNQEKAEIEITRHTKGEHAARLLMNKQATADRAQLGLTEVQEHQMEVQQKLAEDRRYFREMQDMQQKLTDMELSRTAKAASGALESADYSYKEHGGSATSVLQGMDLTADAEKLQIINENLKEIRALERERNNLGTGDSDPLTGFRVDGPRGAGDKGKQKTINDQIAEAKKAGKQALEEHQTAADRKKEQFQKADQARTDANNMSRVESRKAELEMAGTMLDQRREQTGKFSEFQVVDNIQERYKAELAILELKANQEAKVKNGAELAELENQLAMDKYKAGLKYLDVLKQQMDIKHAMEAADKAKRDKSFFGEGAMSAEDYDAFSKQRDADFRSNYEKGNAVERDKKERQRMENILGMGGKPTAEDFANSKKTGVGLEGGVKFEPLEVNINVNHMDPYWTKTTQKKTTSTTVKNTNTKVPGSQRGKPADLAPSDNYPTGGQ